MEQYIMAFKRIMINELGIVLPAGPGSHANPAIVTDATAGNLTITATAISAGVARFTGAGGAVTYTVDSIANLAPVLKGMNVGDMHQFKLVNTAAQTATVAGTTGVTAIEGNLTVNATSKTFGLVKTAGTLADGTDSTYDLYSL